MPYSRVIMPVTLHCVEVVAAICEKESAICDFLSKAADSLPLQESTMIDHLVALLLVASSVGSVRLPDLILPGVSWSQHAEEHPALQALSDNSTVQNSRPLIGILSQARFFVQSLVWPPRAISAQRCLHLRSAHVFDVAACVQHCIIGSRLKRASRAFLSGACRLLGLPGAIQCYSRSCRHATPAQARVMSAQVRHRPVVMLQTHAELSALAAMWL